MCDSSPSDWFSCYHSHAGFEEWFCEVRFIFKLCQWVLIFLRISISDIMYLFLQGMHKMKKQLMIRKRLDGSTFMVMYLDIQSTNLCLLQPLGLAPSCSLCKELIYLIYSEAWCSLYVSSFCLQDYCLVFNTSYLLPALYLFSFLPWLVYFIHTIVELCLLHWWSYMLWRLALRDIQQPLSIVSWKERTG